MSEPQLERSVLEAKEREELFAIAEALGTKPGSRAKKADLILQILRATGVIVDDQPADGAADKPRRATRARKATASATAIHDQGDLLAEASPATGADAKSPTEGAAGVGGASATGRGAPSRAAAPAADGRGAPSRAAAPAADGRGAPSRAAAPAADGRGAPSRAAAPADGREGVAAGHSPAGSTVAGGPPSTAPGQPGGAAVSVNGAGAQGQGATGGGHETFDARSATGGAGSANGSRDGGVDDRDDDAGPPPGAGSDGGSTYAGRGSGHPAQQAHGGPTGPGQAGGPPGQARFDGDLGNRRNRRRRGRERTAERPPGADRDLQAQAEIAFSGEPVAVQGFLDLRDEGYGFLRTRGYLPSPNDVYVSISQVRRFALRKGDEIEGGCRPAGSTEKYPALLRIDSVSGLSPDEARMRPRFDDLTPLFPDQKLPLETPGDPANLTARIVDLISPIGKGQRGLIVSPPKAGKTTVLKQIAHSIETNNPEVVLMVLLVDERPEEVTDMQRSVKGEVIASTFDRPAEEHTAVAELTIERAKRLVERGKDVVIVLDGITRLARAYNLAQPASGRVMSGGIDTGALYPPKKFFGSARNIEEGGSLTILATALVETGSRMDEVIFEEFKGTGNMELRLDRRLAERRLYPALDVNASSTRHEELLFDHQQLQSVWKLRRVLNALGTGEGSEAAGLQLLMDKIRSTKSNDEFLAEVAKTPAPSL